MKAVCYSGKRTGFFEGINIWALVLPYHIQTIPLKYYSFLIYKIWISMPALILKIISESRDCVLESNFKK